ncbi:peptide chain release factor N(5)-glutamine methyltransferase [Enterococcus wangshanyuanii]|uniref:Release factor glutamine methyltransferase n=1 Tax=Enterococcus wangshanyuanii TaxID=2005703 RepID=A0ABQ1NKE4_9ENTE|nr:peptide chain release factor N(5)-glutamine methyltransferase [Enterococcus wangshanyuanii]GGC79006.1 release factor glutamine methyltransferase [Enterococcus wangshanyuanii]
MGNRYFEVLKRASSFLDDQGVEGQSILFVFLARKQWSKTDWLIHLNDEMTKVEQQQLDADLALLAKHYPAQYILGYADFYEQRFLVNEHTLIPRPETEELVELCLSENSDEPLTVADIGTGTGAIAISLKKNRPNWHVLAVDISAETLKVAEENAERLNAAIDFYQGDLLAPLNETKVDLLISNPPYISNDEWQLMDESVRTFEPKAALFAEHDGLAIYQRLAQEATQVLAPKGKIYLEIGFQQGAAVKKLFQQAFPKYIVRVLKDLSGNDRMVAVTPNEKMG